jgi:hypothetical protein
VLILPDFACGVGRARAPNLARIGNDLKLADFGVKIRSSDDLIEVVSAALALTLGAG